ncbi:MAG: 16S rRNA (guanine(527)-N(7))-methyltransferase RsmG [Deltaproteobacteria bacterium]|nr:16S rRNA (guanine(527)-N(7))-methyltransferase RsmG [Deltaproteobacteria bacterium]
MKTGGRSAVPPGPDAALIRDCLREAGLDDAAAAADGAAAHAGEMMRWNRAIRLTAIVDPVEVAVKHIVDSLELLRFAPFPGRLLDFGSGAGYPGIPLAICLPGTWITLLEASAKKCAFLSRVRGMLGLSNVKVVQERISSRERPPLSAFDHIVTRATYSTAETVRLLSPYLAEGGRLLLMKGPKDIPEEEFQGAVTRRERFLLPRGMGEREIVEISHPLPHTFHHEPGRGRRDR